MLQIMKLVVGKIENWLMTKFHSLKKTIKKTLFVWQKDTDLNIQKLKFKDKYIL